MKDKIKIHALDLAVFIIVLFFLLLGLARNWPEILLKEMDRAPAAGAYSPVRITDRVESVLEKELRYHDLLLTLNSVKENLLGTRVIIKSDTPVIKTDSGKLVGDIQKTLFTEKELADTLAYVGNIRALADRVSADFLCCVVPAKTTYEILPMNVRDFRPENQRQILHALTDKGIPVLDMKTSFWKKNLADEDLFFATDHHWRPHTGFAAYQAICEELWKLYGFEYNHDAADIRRFEVESYPDWFLGSYGKKVGLCFTWGGADDFELITPVFPTSFTEEIPAENLVREGDFSDALLRLEHMKKDYYGENPFLTYGGDYRYQVIRNRLLPDGPKIVVVRSSYACVVTPFLALQASELHLVDDREGDYPKGEPIDLEKLINEVCPDYVLLIKQL